MGWKGTIRSYNAAAKRNQREAIRRKKTELAQQAFDLVQRHEALIESLLTFHHRVTNPIDWDIDKPIKQKKTCAKEIIAKKKYDNFRPNFLHKLLGNEVIAKENLRKRIDTAKISDQKDYEDNLRKYEEDLTSWQEFQEKKTSLINRNLKNIKSIIEEINPFHELAEHGLTVYLIKDQELIIKCKMGSMDFMQFYNAKYMKSGKVKTVKMGKRNAREHAEDVCSSIALKLARESFNILPIKSLIVSIVTDHRDKSTGKLIESTIYKAKIKRKELENIEFEYIDPSSCLENFEVLEKMKLDIVIKEDL